MVPLDSSERIPIVSLRHLEDLPILYSRTTSGFIGLAGHERARQGPKICLRSSPEMSAPIPHARILWRLHDCDHDYVVC